VRNDDYHWPPAIAHTQGAPYLDEIVFRDIGDTDTRLASLEAGETQVIAMTEPQVAQVKDEKDIQVLTTPKAGTTRMYLMNVAKPPTDDLKVRQALNYAVDKKALLQLPAWSGIGNPAVAPLPANMFPGGTIPPSLKELDYGFDLDKARALLDQAGWVAGPDGMRQKDGKPLVLDAVTVPMFTNQVEPIDQMFRKVGAQLNIRTGDFNFIVSATKGGDYHLWITSDSGYDASAMVYEYFNTKGTSARTGYNNPDVNKDLDAALTATSQKDLWDNLVAAQAQVLKDAVGIMGWEQLYVYGARSSAHDVGYSEIGYPWFYDTWLSK
jgi:peptide/nickel transport system substrate-binding protein